MNRIVILGCSGSGKSTLSQRIGERTGLPVHHLDSYFWKPGWVAEEPAAFDAEVIRLTAGERWIIDGNYSRTLDLRLQRSDTVIFFDYPRYLCLYRVWKRRFQYAGRSRADMGEGCPEKIDLAFLKWIWFYRKRNRPKLLNKLREAQKHQDVYIFRHPREANEFLKLLPQEPKKFFL